jgi:demethylmenaquinone methyltransferase/2-methoxy-6-polyprenyl-1,4-benzoquinol methylase
MPLLSHFDVFAPFYDSFIKTKNPIKLGKFAHLPIDGYLLDAGGGTGRVADSLKNMASCFVVADLSYSMLRQAIKKDGLHVVCSQSEELPFLDESFERVIMVDALHHVYNSRITAHELWRVVKPGGYIVIEEPDVRTFTVKLVALVEKIALMRSHFLSPIKIKALFSYPNASIQIERDGYTAWVIIEKRFR